MLRGTPVRVTADGVILTSGKPIMLYAASITSGVTPGRVQFRNGTATTDTALLDVDGEPARTTLVPNIPSGGLYFPAGLFVDVDGNASAVVCWAEMME